MPLKYRVPVAGNVTIVGVPPGMPALSASGGALAKGRDLVTGAHEMIAGMGLASLLGLEVGDLNRLSACSDQPNLAHPEGDAPVAPVEPRPIALLVERPALQLKHRLG